MKPRLSYFIGVVVIGFGVRRIKLLYEAVFASAGKALLNLCSGLASRTSKKVLVTVRL
jgi:hypothetical protein